jgi:hypothetical protein
VRTGLRLYLESAQEMREVRFAGMEASGLEPWTLVAEAAALMTYARHGSTPDDSRARDELAALAREKTRALLEVQPMHLDYPVSGMSLAALAQWLIGSDRVALQEEGIQLLALADRFSYNRSFPVMAWAPLAEYAEEVDPGRLDALLTKYDGRPGRELLGEAIAALDRVTTLLGGS